MKKENYKPLICPVCGEFYFSPLSKSDIETGDTGIGSQCTICGWKYDLDQLNDNNCISKLKDDFRKKRKKNPRYKFYEEHKTKKVKHLCPVCKQYIFEDINSYDICPFCGWEDEEYGVENPDSDGGANHTSLNDMIKMYNQKLKK